jgi:hypothetical protein
MSLGLCLSASAFAQSVTNSQLSAFPCQSTTPWFCADGAKPTALIQASDGNFYGTTETSYASHSNTVHITGGTIFKITPSGQFTLLYTFKPNPKTGYFDQGESANSLAEGSGLEITFRPNPISQAKHKCAMIRECSFRVGRASRVFCYCSVTCWPPLPRRNSRKLVRPPFRKR